MRFWWVNHNKTWRQETGEGYLWSPKLKKKGHRNPFYDTMREARPGDLVLSYARSRVAFVGEVAHVAISAVKPPSFGAAGHAWDNDGWLLPVGWRALAQSVRTIGLAEEIGHWLPAKYSPISPQTGGAYESVYLAEIPSELFYYLLDRAGGWPGEEARASVDPLTARDRFESDLERQIEDDLSLDITQREQLVNARRGQGTFRRRVSQLEKSCRLTGVTNPDLLIASHIKPWRACTTAHERLDGANGLLLTRHVDHLFDEGLISFTDTGQVLRSPRLADADVQSLGLDKACAQNVGTFSEQQRNYLDYHRRAVFVPK